MQAAVLSGINLRSENNAIKLDLKSAIEFKNEEEIQNSVALLGKDVMSNNTKSEREIGAAGFIFGSDTSPENIVDTFSKVAVSVNVAEYIPKMNELYRKLTDISAQEVQAGEENGAWKDLKISMEKVDVDVPETNSISFDVGSKISGLPMDVKFDIPFIGFGVTVNSDNLILGQVAGLKYDSGSLAVKPQLQFFQNDNAYQNLATILGQILFNRGEAGDTYVIPHTLNFGFSKDTSVKTFQKLQLPVNIKNFVAKKIAEKPDPTKNSILNWWSVVTEEGIVTDLEFPGDDWSFLNVKAKVLGRTAYQKNKEGEVAFVANVPIFDIKLPKAKIILVPILENDQTARAMYLGTEKFISFQDFGSDSRHGYVTLTGTGGAKFSVLQNTYFWSNELKLFHPIKLNLVPMWPWDPKDPFDLRLPIKMLMSFRNGGPLHLDMGTIRLEVKNEGKRLISLNSEGDWIVRNYLEGAGDDKNLVNQGKFHVEVPLSSLSPIAIIKVIDTLLNKKGLEFELNFNQDGKDISYVPKIFKALNSFGGFSELGPLMAAILANLQFEFMGIGKDDFEFVQRILDEVRKWMQKHFPGLKDRIPTLPSSEDRSLAAFSQPGAVTVIESQNFVVVSH
jgi:hypothetical protein